MIGDAMPSTKPISAGSLASGIPPTPRTTPVVAIARAIQGRGPDGACAKKIESTATMAGKA